MDKHEMQALTGNRWVHSHEEDHGDEMVFRPASYPFPPSRGRRSFELQADGSLTDTVPGPTDRPQSQGGRWSLVDDKLTLKPASAGDLVMRIRTVAPDRLVVEKG